MMRETKPDVLIVTTVDATHDEFIIKGMKMGADIITEKPMTTDEVKCQNILDTERETGKNVVVTFNYRYSPHRHQLKELLAEGRIGKVTSADFHWYLDTRHGADYFRRWHRLRENSGTLLVHKATHHFDLLNWWLDSDPLEVFGNGALEFYGKNGPFRHTHCRPCPHKDDCQFHWDITRTRRRRPAPDPATAQAAGNTAERARTRGRRASNMDLYVANEQYDGYHRDGCVFREDIDIYDKMAVQIKYANNVHVSYSLTTYSPYEGYRIAFNGTKGRLEAWIQERQPWERKDHDELRLTDNFGETQIIEVPKGGGGHGGGDTRLRDRIFKDPNAPDPLRQSAGTRDGAMSVLIGVAARKSIEEGKKINIADLTDLVPQAVRPT
jgi:predicted dehydrogenase